MHNTDDPFRFTPRVIDIDVASVSRVYDYFLGGSHNFAVDREFAAKVEADMPGVRRMAQLNRAFQVSAVRTLKAMGYRQFLDLGSGMPSADTGATHSLAPDATVVYVDNDPVAVASAEILLTNAPYAHMVDGDFTKPDDLLNDDVIQSVLDWTRPVAIIMCAALHLVAEQDDPYALVRAYRGACVTGSALALSNGTADGCPNMTRIVDRYRSIGVTYQPRGIAQMCQLMDGYTLLEPGIELTGRWHCDRPITDDEADESGAYACVGVLS